ncbi:MAG: two-component system sensor histidine kinase/response regulator [Phenylobacterium sp.]|jgi:two-component system sensor histidine kinase/response regulator
MTDQGDGQALRQQIKQLQDELQQANLDKAALERKLVASSMDNDDMQLTLEQTQADLEWVSQSATKAQSYADLAFDSMDSLLIMLDRRGNIFSINSAITKELGYELSELVGQPVDCLFCPLDLAVQGFAQTPIFDLVGEQSRFTGQHVLLTNQLQQLTYIVKVNLLYDRHEKLVGGIFCAQNITSLLSQRQELKKSEMVLDLFMKTANDAFIVIDDADNIIVWNAKAEALFGYSSKEAQLKKAHEFLVSPDDKAQFDKGVPYFSLKGSLPSINNTREVKAYRKDGSSFVSEVSISSGRIEGRWHAFGVVRDISERKAVENALITAKTAADEANLAKSTFLATMSHEIRTPINGIIGMLHLCQQTQLDSQQQDYINKTEFSATNLLTVINDILDFSKVESGKMELETAPFSLQALKESVLSSVEVKAQQKGLSLDVNIPLEVPLDLIGDVNRLSQILLNLTSNAIKFTDTGMVNIEVALIEQYQNQKNGQHGKCCRLKFSVTDTGIGISETSLPHLFESFKQADSSTTRKFGGTGLGLAISLRLAQLMGGTIDVKSTLGTGSCFWIELDFGVNDHFVLAQAEPTEPVLFSQRFNIVLVDDNAISLQIVETALIKMGAEVQSFSQVAAAIAYIETNTPDLILSDWKMPNVDGVSFFRELEAHKLLSPALRILMSAYTGGDSNSDQLKAIELSIDAVIKKPLNLKHLKEVVEECLLDRERSKPVQTSIKGKRILVAEDNAINAQVIEAILTSFEIVVEVVENGKLAVEKVRNNRYDLILMDIQMPEMDGVEATTLIRQELADDTPIAALTANVLATDIETYLNAGMNEHIAKPIEPDKLRGIISRLLGVV